MELKEGMVFKNYRRLCEFMDWEIVSGNSKKAQLRKLDCLCKYRKEGQNIIIMKVFEKPKEPYKRLEKYTLITGAFGIPHEKGSSIGVYIISNDEKTYIGSTASSFRKRFLSHWSNDNKLQLKTYDLLHNKGTFRILEEMNGCSEIEIREMEEKYIKLYSENKNINLINVRETTHTNRPRQNKKSKQDKKSKKLKSLYKIKVLSKNYDKVVELLKENNLIAEGE